MSCSYTTVLSARVILEPKSVLKKNPQPTSNCIYFCQYRSFWQNYPRHCSYKGVRLAPRAVSRGNTGVPPEKQNFSSLLHSLRRWRHAGNSSSPPSLWFLFTPSRPRRMQTSLNGFPLKLPSALWRWQLSKPVLSVIFQWCNCNFIPLSISSLKTKI